MEITYNSLQEEAKEQAMYKEMLSFLKPHIKKVIEESSVCPVCGSTKSVCSSYMSEEIIDEASYEKIGCSYFKKCKCNECGSKFNTDPVVNLFFTQLAEIAYNEQTHQMEVFDNSYAKAKLWERLCIGLFIVFGSLCLISILLLHNSSWAWIPTLSLIIFMLVFVPVTISHVVKRKSSEEIQYFIDAFNEAIEKSAKEGNCTITLSKKILKNSRQRDLALEINTLTLSNLEDIVKKECMDNS